MVPSPSRAVRPEQPARQPHFVGMDRGTARHGLCVLVEPRLEDAGLTRPSRPLSLLVKKKQLLASKERKFAIIAARAGATWPPAK